MHLSTHLFVSLFLIFFINSNLKKLKNEYIYIQLYRFFYLSFVHLYISINPLHLFIYIIRYSSVLLSMHLPIYLFIHSLINLFFVLIFIFTRIYSSIICLSIYPSIHPSIHPSIYLSIYLIIFPPFNSLFPSSTYSYSYPPIGLSIHLFLSSTFIY